MSAKSNLRPFISSSFVIIVFSLLTFYIRSGNVVQAQTDPFSVIATIPVGNNPNGIAVNEVTNRIYVTNFTDNTVSVIDGGTNTVVATVSVGVGPNGIAVNPLTNKIYVATLNTNNQLFVIDGNSNSVVAEIPVDGDAFGVGINPYSDRIYVSVNHGNLNGPYVHVIDGATDDVVSTINCGIATDPVRGISGRYCNPSHVVVDPTTGKVYVHDYNAMVVVIDNTDTVVSAIAGVGGGSNDFALGLNTRSRRLYVGSSRLISGIVSVINLDTQETVSEVPLPYNSTVGGIGTNANVNHAYISMSPFIVLDGATNTFNGDPLPISGGAVAVNQVTNRAYAVNSGDDTVVVIDDSYPCASTSWYGEYFPNRNLSGPPVFYSCDSKIDFYWGNNSPILNQDNFSIRWQKAALFPKSGFYKFRTLSDDGVRLFIDGAVVIDEWQDQVVDEHFLVKYVEQGVHQVSLEYFEHTGYSLAYLNWYFCPQGLLDCSLNVTPIYQTSSQYLSESMPTDSSTTDNQTLARWGCLLVATVMDLQKLGVNTSPSELNEWLSNNGGYQRIDDCEACLNRDQILVFARDPNHGGKELIWKGTSDVTKTIREERLPVIMQAYNSTDGPHYVLAVDVAELNGVQTLGINDPWFGFGVDVVSDDVDPHYSKYSAIGVNLKHAITTIEESQYRGSISVYHYLAPLGTARRSLSLQLNTRGIEVLLVDNQGRRVGYDASANSVFLEIPDSVYINSAADMNEGDVAASQLRTLYIPNDAPTHFTLRIVRFLTTAQLNSMSSSSYEVTILGNDENFNPVSLTITVNPNAIYDVSITPGVGVQIVENFPVFLPFVKR